MLDTLRQFRIFDYAAFDLILSIVGMWILAPLLSKLFLKIGVRIPKISWVIWVLPIGIISHLIVGSLTPMTVQFFDPSSHYILKIVIVFLLVFGFRGVKRVKR